MTDSQYVTDAIDGYLECALWASVGGENYDTPLDDLYDEDDIEPAARAEMEDDVRQFVADNDVLDLDPGQVGHDFWLTRNHHGAGFWDRGLGERGRQLTDAAHAYGSCDLVETDQGTLVV